MKSKIISAVLMLCVALPLLAEGPAVNAARAADAGQAKKPIVSVNLLQTKIVKGADGREKAVDAVSVKPGDVIEYKAVYTNTGKQPVKGMLARLPVPDGMEYLPKSAKPASSGVKAATKDGEFAVEPLTRKGPGGVTEPVPYNEYRVLRWDIGELKAGASVAVSVRAKVEAVVPKVSNIDVQPIKPGAPPAAAR